MSSELISRLYVNSLVERKQRLYPGTLEPYGRKVYSQTDEDGILEEILFRLGMNSSNMNYLEIGVGSGTENNTLKLLSEGSRGVWVEGNTKKAEECASLARSYIQEGQLLMIKSLVTSDNVMAVAEKACSFLGTESIDVFSIDIDGPDYDLTRMLISGGFLSPQIIVCEYNGRFGSALIANDDYASVNDEKRLPPHFYYGTGSSLQRWVSLLSDYVLVACGILGINAFFVRKDRFDSYKFPNTNVRELYNPLDLQPWLDGAFKQRHGFPSKLSIYG